MYKKVGLVTMYALSVTSAINMNGNWGIAEDLTKVTERLLNSQERSQSELDLDLTTTEWLEFAAGVLVGLSTEYAENLENECMASSAGLIMSGAHVYEYMMAYIDSGEEDTLMLAYALTYIISAFEVLTHIEADCEHFQEDINTWLTDLSGSFSPDENTTDEANPDLMVEATKFVRSVAPLVFSHEDFTLPEEEERDIDASIYDADTSNNTATLTIFNQIYQIIWDFNIMMQIIETALVSNEFITAWEEEKYYEAGYELGSGGLGVIFLLEDISEKYDELQENDEATDVTEDEEEEEEEEECSFDC